MIKVIYNKHFIDGNLKGDTSTQSIDFQNSAAARKAKKIISSARSEAPKFDCKGALYYTSNVRVAVCR